MLLLPLDFHYPYGSSLRDNMNKKLYLFQKQITPFKVYEKLIIYQNLKYYLKMFLVFLHAFKMFFAFTEKQ